MSMTLWVHTLEGRQLTSHQDDHSLLYRYHEALDAAGASGGAKPLSSFFDYTDLRANFAQEFGGEEEATEPAEEKLDPETGWSYGIDDMTWFPVKEGRAALMALREMVQAGGASVIPEKHLTSLVAELESALAKLEQAAGDGEARFHLAVVA